MCVWHNWINLIYLFHLIFAYFLLFDNLFPCLLFDDFIDLPTFLGDKRDEDDDDDDEADDEDEWCMANSLLLLLLEFVATAKAAAAAAAAAAALSRSHLNLFWRLK